MSTASIAGIVVGGTLGWGAFVAVVHWLDRRKYERGRKHWDHTHPEYAPPDVSTIKAMATSQGAAYLAKLEAALNSPEQKAQERKTFVEGKWAQEDDE